MRSSSLRRSSVVVSILAPLLTLGSACGSVPATPDGGERDGAPSSDGAPIDTPTGPAPEVVSVTPADAANAVEPAAPVTAVFSIDMDPASIDVTTFKVVVGTADVPGTVSYDAASKTATFTPSAGLPLTGTLVATIGAAVRSAGGAGLAADHRWTFTVRDGDWQAAEHLELSSNDASAPQVATDGKGNAMALWTQVEGMQSDLLAARFQRTRGWASPKRVESAATAPVGAGLALDGVGTAFAVWRQDSANRPSIWANRFDPSNETWGTAALLETDDQQYTYSTRVAASASGTAVAIWDNGNQIYTNRYAAASGWSMPQRVDIGNTYSPNPDVATNDAGQIAAVWIGPATSHYSVWSNRVRANGQWDEPKIMGDAQAAGDARSPRIVLDSSGNAIAVWAQLAAGNVRNDIWANRFDVGNGWGTAQLLETNNAASALSPDAAVDGQGNVVAVWAQSDGTRYSIWSNRFVPGTGWGTARLIETSDQDAGSPQVAADLAGNVVAVWTQSDGSRVRVWANRFVGAAGWGTPRAIDSATGGASATPSVALDAGGFAQVVWAQSDGTRNDIWANTLR